MNTAKLQLKKEEISRLSNRGMGQVKGGCATDSATTSCYGSNQTLDTVCICVSGPVKSANCTISGIGG